MASFLLPKQTLVSLAEGRLEFPCITDGITTTPCLPFLRTTPTETMQTDSADCITACAALVWESTVHRDTERVCHLHLSRRFAAECLQNEMTLNLTLSTTNTTEQICLCTVPSSLRPLLLSSPGDFVNIVVPDPLRSLEEGLPDASVSATLGAVCIPSKSFKKRCVKALRGAVRMEESVVEAAWTLQGVDVVVPLGPDCRIAQALRGVGIAQRTFPFDWVRSASIEVVLGNIRGNTEATPIPLEWCGGNAFQSGGVELRHTQLCGVVSSHHGAECAAVQFRRRIERLRDVLLSHPQMVVFMASDRDDEVHPFTVDGKGLGVWQVAHEEVVSIATFFEKICGVLSEAVLFVFKCGAGGGGVRFETFGPRFLCCTVYVEADMKTSTADVNAIQQALPNLILKEEEKNRKTKETGLYLHESEPIIG